MFHKKKIKQKGGRLSFAYLPCKESERVQYSQKRPSCHLWNTPQCGYGCGTCAGSDGCMNYPFGQTFSVSHVGGPATVCNMDLDSQEGGGCGCHIKGVADIAMMKQMRESKGSQYMEPAWGEVPENKCDFQWYSQQCQMGGGHLGDCAGSGTRFGCGCGGGGCQDCSYYNKLAKNYRHMLTGAMYPFCKY